MRASPVAAAGDGLFSLQPLKEREATSSSRGPMKVRESQADVRELRAPPSIRFSLEGALPCRIRSMSGHKLVVELQLRARRERQDELHLRLVHILIFRRRREGPVTGEVAPN